MLNATVIIVCLMVGFFWGIIIMCLMTISSDVREHLNRVGRMTLAAQDLVDELNDMYTDDEISYYVYSRLYDIIEKWGI